MARNGLSPENPNLTSSHDRILASAKRLFAGQGYENTSTMAIARMAGTSESQMMKHFGSKEGLLEAILDQGWSEMGIVLEQINAMPASPEKLARLLEVVLQALEHDSDLKELMLLEGRRIRREGKMVLLSAGYVKFVELVDGVLRELASRRQLRADIKPEAVRSALMGMIEGLLRDQILAKRLSFPAAYNSQDLHKIFYNCLSSLLMPTPTKGKAVARRR